MSETLRHFRGVHVGRLGKRIVAEAVSAALRLQDKAAGIVKCVREPDFVELYGAIGDRWRQDEIREGNREQRHCRWLADDANACDVFPEAIGDAKGAPCPNNPYHGPDAKLITRLEDQWQLIEAAHYIADLSALGKLPDLDALTPAEYHVARIMRQHELAQEYRLRQMQSAQMITGTESE